MTQSSKTFYIFRHGLATHSKYGYGKKIITARILPEGVPAIQKMGEHLRSVPDSLNLTSEFIRCRETSEIVGVATSKVFSPDSRLNEKHHEDIQSVRARVESLLSDIEKQKKQIILICTHGTIITAIKNLLINGKFVTRMLGDYPQPGELMIIDKGKVNVINFN